MTLSHLSEMEIAEEPIIKRLIVERFMTSGEDEDPAPGEGAREGS